MKKKQCFICGDKLMVIKNGKKLVGTLCINKKHAEMWLGKKLTTKAYKDYYKTAHGISL